MSFLNSPRDMLIRWWAVCVLLGVALGQPSFLGGSPEAQVLRLEAEAQRFLQFRTKNLILVGATPPVGDFQRLLTGKTLLVIAGEADRSRLTWVPAANLRLLPGKVNGDFLMADDRYILVRKGQEWLLLDHPPTVLILKQQLFTILQYAVRK